MAGRRFFFEHAGKTIAIGDEEVRIGSAPDCTIVVAGKGVEPLVAVARREDDGVVLESRAREHEARVNDKPLSVAELAEGTELRLGDVEMKVRGSGVDVSLESSEGSFPIKVGANLIGRAPEASVMVDHPTVSRKHALVFLLASGQARVRHLGAQNGTFVDGVRLGQVELSQGDRIEIGDDRIFFLTGPAAPAAAAADAAEAQPEGGTPPPPDATVIAGRVPLPAPPEAPPEPPPEPAGPTFELIVDGETRTLGPGAFVIGRTPDCDLSFPEDALVSRRHTQLTVGPDEVRLRDLGSSNGTLVNGHRVEREITLADGDHIGIGGADVLFKAIRPADPFGATVLAPAAPPPAFERTMLAPGGGAAAAAAASAAGHPGGDRAAALRALDLPPGAGVEEVRSRYRELYSDYHIRFTNAPTPDLKQRYSRRLDELRQAMELLAPAAGAAAAVEAGDLPAARPVSPGSVAARGGGPPAGRGAPPAAPQAPAPPASPVPPAPAPQPSAPGPRPPAAHAAASRRSLPRSTWVMIGVALLLIAVTGVFTALYQKVAATEAGLVAELADKHDELAAMQQRIPQAGQEFEVLQQLKGSKLENLEVKICNLGSRPLFVDWLHASWVGADGNAFGSFNSAMVGYETWEIAPGGTGKFGYVSGDQVIWDGRAVFFSVLLSYAGEEIFRSGAVETLGPDCYNLDLDR